MYCVGDSLESSMYPQGDLRRNKEGLELDRHHHDLQQQQQQSSGQMRYRSAPSSFLATLINGGVIDRCEDFQDLPASARSEIDDIFETMVCGDGSGDDYVNSHDLQSIDGEGLKHEGFQSVLEQNGSYYQSSPSSLHGFQNRNTSVDFRSSVSLENVMQIKTENGNSSNLVKQHSSPAGFFSNLVIENGYEVLKGTGASGNGTNGGEATPPTTRLKNQINFSSEPTSSSRLMDQTVKFGNGSLQNGSGNIDFYMPSFANDTWNDPMLGDQNRSGNGKRKMFSESQNEDAGNCTSVGLTRHSSLPKSSHEMAAILRFQDSPPLKIRAKRGCATHPRSIAERVRRTRISERLRKVQELFPDMDKQMNTSDMLDLAVEYIKDLQNQVKTLMDKSSKCTCSSKHERLLDAKA